MEQKFVGLKNFVKQKILVEFDQNFDRRKFRAIQ